LLTELRLAGPADLEEVARLERVCFPDPWPLEVLEECMDLRSGIRFILALDGGRVRGYTAAAIPSPGILHVVNLCVARSHRRRGLAGMLLDVIERWGSTCGALWSFLEVRVTNRAAVGLYTGRGYLPCEHLPAYYGEKRHGLRLARRLPAEGRDERAALAEAIRGLVGGVPPVGVVLGSGLSWIADTAGTGEEIPWEALPGMSGDLPPGHRGSMRLSPCGSFVFLLGRRHRYQGYDADRIVLLPSVLSDLGVRTWVLTSSAGAVSHRFSTGDAMVFSDHVNLSGCVPGVACRTGRDVYSPRLRRLAADCATRLRAPVREGVFACVTGPAYETAAELRLLRSMGVDAVSMSTAQEALAVRCAGCEALGVALITNSSAPGTVVTHDEVLSAQDKLRSCLVPFLGELLGELADDAVR
jgi:purine-nucleoside phosphorylase